MDGKEGTMVPLKAVSFEADFSSDDGEQATVRTNQEVNGWTTSVVLTVSGLTREESVERAIAALRRIAETGISFEK